MEYCMSAQLAQMILGKKKNSNPQKLLCDFVNEQFGLLYPCTKVNIV